MRTPVYVPSPAAGDLRRALYGFVSLMLVTVATRSSLGMGFNVAPRLARGGVKAVHRSATRPLMAQQSAALELVDDAEKLPGIAKAVFAQDTRPVLLYDGVCNMCNGFVNLFLDIDTDKKFRFSALQSQTGRALLSLSGRSPDDISRSVCVNGLGCFCGCKLVISRRRPLGTPRSRSAQA